MGLRQANQTSFKKGQNVGRHASVQTEFKKGHPGYWKGKKFSEKHKEKILEANIERGKLFQKGCVPWSKGKTKEEFPQLVKTEQWRENISKALVGKKPWNKGKKGVMPVAWNKGLTKETNESLMKISKAQMGRNNSNWNGGISSLYEIIRACPTSNLWKKAIFTRDNWQCQDCGKFAGGHLQAHHIKPFAELLEENEIVSLGQALKTEELWDITNGVTYCEECHMKRHRKKNGNS